MAFSFETTLGQFVNTVDKNFHEIIKKEIKARLMQHAEQVVEEAAIQISKDLIMRIEHAQSPSEMALDIRMTLNVGGKDRKFLVKKVVEQA